MLILASASEARHQLLKQAQIPHKVIISNFDESSVKNKKPKEFSEALAYSKSNTVLEKLLFEKQDLALFDSTEKTFILGCDSIFEFQGEILGKPRDQKEAINRLILMSNQSGILHTGHNLIILEEANGKLMKKYKSKVISTIVGFSNYKKAEIEGYVERAKVVNCAGGFTLEGEGSKFIKYINGCYSNVIGLSIPWLKEAIEQ
mgnify:CR=1 FL=1